MAGRPGYDHFIFVDDDPSASRAAPWARRARSPAGTIFLASEDDNGWSGWFDTTESVMSSASAVQSGGSYLEGALDLAALYGSVPDSILVAVAGYGSGDGAALSEQTPAGNGNGVIERTEYDVLDLTATGVEEGEAVTTATLFPVSPNPTAAGATVRFRMLSAGHVRLAVYDVRGRLVSVLREGEAGTGEHGVAWDGLDDRGRALPSGVYFCRLATPGGSTAREDGAPPVVVREAGHTAGPRTERPRASPAAFLCLRRIHCGPAARLTAAEAGRAPDNVRQHLTATRGLCRHQKVWVDVMRCNRSTQRGEAVKAVGLLSGGLDSTVAIQLMLDQGIEVTAFNIVSAFCCCTPHSSSCSSAATAVKTLGIELRTVNVTDEFLPIVANPEHARGSGMNPCLDCRILMFRKAKEYMDEVGASFIVTGDVLGQRPMSQRRDAMKLIDNESGLTGYVLRPLSAALLEPTVPETEGWVDREKLLAVSGRSRKPQMDLADEMGIGDYPCPAGGCLLTDPIFAQRLRDLLRHAGELWKEDVTLLKLGRHFRLSAGVKAIVGRDQKENHLLANQMREGDHALEVSGQPGPLTLVRGEVTDDELAVAAAITSRYGKSGGRAPTTVLCRKVGGGAAVGMSVGPVDRDVIRSLMIGGGEPVAPQVVAVPGAEQAGARPVKATDIESAEGADVSARVR